MVQITGKYKRTSTENFEEFLNKLEVGSILKKAALASAPTMEVSVTLVVELGFRSESCLVIGFYI